MTKGIGVGAEILGEATGELVKPGLTQTELDAIEQRTVDDGPDPMGEVFRERQAQRS